MSIQVIQSASILLENNGHHGPTRNDGIYQQQQQQHHTSSSSSHDINIMTITNMYTNTNTPPCFLSSLVLDNNNNNNYREGEERQEQEEEEEEEVGGGERKRRREQQHQEEEEEREYQVKLGGLLITAIRRSVLGCSSSCDTIINTRRAYMSGMEIGVPTNVRHVAHVTFDRFNGFLGLPVEFEPDVPRRPPSASTTVFGVSTNSMQLSYDTRGNSVPTILLLMQHRLYGLGGLQAEGIFRINPDNGQEEYVRDQLNRGLIPDDVDVHCLAGLIKAWFRELPTGVLDCLSPEQVMESQTEEECFHLAKLLPPTEAALLDWAVNLMADVAQFEHLNKMNARNVAMVFAPNMTHMADPLTALMHAVQVMNFLKTLIERTLKEREDSILDSALDSYSRDPSGDNGCHTPLQTIQEENNDSEPDVREDHTPKALNSVTEARQEASTQESKIITPEDQNKTKPSNRQKNGKGVQTTSAKKGPRKNNEKLVIQLPKSTEKTKGTILVSSVKLRNERVEAWR